MSCMSCQNSQKNRTNIVESADLKLEFASQKSEGGESITHLKVKICKKILINACVYKSLRKYHADTLEIVYVKSWPVLSITIYKRNRPF